MQKRLQRLHGVAKVEVNLVGQKVTLISKSDGTVNLEEVLKATYEGGVSPVEMIVTASGLLARDSAGALLFKPAANQSFEVVQNEAAQVLANLAGSANQVTLKGVMFREPASKKKPKSFGPLRFEVLEVLKKQ